MCEGPYKPLIAHIVLNYCDKMCFFAYLSSVDAIWQVE